MNNIPYFSLPLLVMLAGGACASSTPPVNSAPPVSSQPSENDPSSTLECPDVVVHVLPQVTNPVTIQQLFLYLYPRVFVARIRGTVGVRLLIQEDGSLVGLEIAESSGRAQIDSAALTAMVASEWSPALRDGVPVSACVIYPITFNIND